MQIQQLITELTRKYSERLQEGEESSAIKAETPLLPCPLRVGQGHFLRKVSAYTQKSAHTLFNFWYLIPLNVYSIELLTRTSYFHNSYQPE